MTNFLHWRRMTWTLLAWSAAMTAWILTGSIDATRVGVLWVAGMTFLSLLLLATQPLFQQGRGLSGIFVKPGWGSSASSTSTGHTGDRSPGIVRVKAEPRRHTGFVGAGRFDAERKRPLTESAVSAVASSADAPDGLDWQTFSAAYFPGRRRHDLEALTAYGAYRRSRTLDARPSSTGHPDGGNGERRGGIDRATGLGRRRGRHPVADDVVRPRAMGRQQTDRSGAAVGACPTGKPCRAERTGGSSRRPGISARPWPRARRSLWGSCSVTTASCREHVGMGDIDGARNRS